MQETESTFNLAYVFVDLGDPFYRAATHEMVKSARRVMPGVKITQISDKKTPAHPLVDDLFSADIEVTKDDICAFKGHFMAEFAMHCPGDLILCDVDLIWNKKPRKLFSDVYDIGLMRRDGFPSMPFNTGLMLSSGRANAKIWWKHYQELVDDLHKYGIGWYCDQIAAAMAYGLDEESVLDYEMDEVCPAPDTLPTAPMDSYATHFKGPRKEWLFDYAKLVTPKVAA